MNQLQLQIRWDVVREVEAWRDEKTISVDKLIVREREKMSKSQMREQVYQR